MNAIILRLRSPFVSCDIDALHASRLLVVLFLLLIVLGIKVSLLVCYHGPRELACQSIARVRLRARGKWYCQPIRIDDGSRSTVSAASIATDPRDEVPLRRTVVDETKEGRESRRGIEEVSHSLLRRRARVQVWSPHRENVVLLRWLRARAKRREACPD